MNKEERHKLILENLISAESIQVAELAALLSVSTVTIRTDLPELEQENKLYRSHGRALLATLRDAAAENGAFTLKLR